VLPATPRTNEQFRWLAAEINEQGGEAMLWYSETALPKQHEELVKEFATRTESAFQEILDRLRNKKEDLAGLSRDFQRAAAQDFFQSKLADKVRKGLLAKGRGSAK
jgi:hypothetical protein